MTDEIVSRVLASQASLDAYFALSGAENAIKLKIVESLVENVRQVARNYGLAVESSKIAPEPEFEFSKPDMEKRGVRIGFGFSGHKFFFGFRNIVPGNADKIIIMLSKLDHLCGQRVDPPNQWWPCSAYWRGEWECWNHEVYRKIWAKELIGDIEDKLKQMLEVFEEAQNSAQGGDANS